MNKEIVLKRGQDKRVLGGHLWVFSNEVAEIRGEPVVGDTVRLLDSSGRFLGLGFFNPGSLISFRLLSSKDGEIDQNFFEERIRRALEFRGTFLPGVSSFRAVFGEADGLPGLIVDKYEKYLSVQYLSAGMEKNSALIVAALEKIFSPEGIVGRNDSSLRKLEGLEERVDVLSGNVPEKVKIEENGCFYIADLLSGQKTGFFFDQRENRSAIAKYCRGKRVLDCFCHTGAFGINAAKAGASEITWVDSSKPALDLAEENTKLNGLGDKFNGIVSNAGEYLEKLAKEGNKFDIIIVDPPAFIKSRKHFSVGYKAYRNLNASALGLLKSGGILATSSCSHNLSPADFRNMIVESAGRAGVQARLLELRSQGRDHPVLLSMPETEYLKFAIIEVV